MNEQHLAIIIAILSSGALTALITTWLNRRYQQRMVENQAVESMTSGAEKISDSALEQLEYLNKANRELRVQRDELEKGLDEARKNYAAALADISRMEAEYNRAIAGLEQKHELCMLQLAELNNKYTLVLEENIELRKRIRELECNNVRAEGSG